MSDDVTLDEWLGMEIERLASFRRRWIDMNASDPANYPMQMPVGEWDEQMRTFDE